MFRLHLLRSALLIPTLSNCYRAPYAAAEARAVTIFADGGPVGVGTGLIVAPGKVLTCLHVARMSREKLEILFQSERYAAQVNREDPSFDLVILTTDQKVDGPEIHWANEITPGQDVFLVGAAYGLQNSLFRGYVSYTSRPYTDLDFPSVEFVQTYGISFPGTSGAPVYRSDGASIGINRATYGFAAGTGIGLTIPVRCVKKFLETNLTGR